MVVVDKNDREWLDVECRERVHFIFRGWETLANSRTIAANQIQIQNSDI